MSSKWTHIHALLRSSDPSEGLAARIADPLWTLARQRQFGALRGEDAGSPIQLEIAAGHAPVDQFLDPDGTAHPLTRGPDPVEPAVEAENPLTGPARARLSAEAGLDLLMRFSQADARRLRPALQSVFGVPEVSGDPVTDALIRASFDAIALIEAGARRNAAVAREAGIDQTRFEGKRAAWYEEQAARFARSPATKSTWRSDRMAYEFRLRASSIDAELSFSNYDGSRFDWYQAQLSSPTKKAFEATPHVKKAQPLLTRVRYAGMPSRRFWNFEDGNTFFGGVEAGVADLAQMVLTEFATVYSDDWYTVPLQVPTGVLARVTSVKVHDVFSDRPRKVFPAAVEDGAKRSWRFFELGGDASAESAARLSPWLYVPRVTDSAHSGPILEKVQFIRDEAANLAWAIETQVEGRTGRAEDRAANWQRLRSALEALSEEGDADIEDETTAPWRYVLETRVPPWWIPFEPEIGRGGRPTGRLLRRRMLQWQSLPAELQTITGATGRICAPDRPLALRDEAILSGGLTVTRGWQMARSADGRPLFWLGRRKQAAGPMEHSGRETDIAVDDEGRVVDDHAAGRGKKTGGRV